MKYILTIILSLYLINVSAQEIISKIYFDKKNEQVNNIDSAYYLREITAKNESGLYKIKENYLNGSLKLVGQLLNYDPALVFEGLKTSYHLNGVKEAEEDYKKGQKVGDSKSFYQNGNLKEHRVYVDNITKKPKVEILNYRTIQVADSLGKTFLDDNGNGIVNLKQTNGDVEFGKYVNGFKNGTWKSTNLNKDDKFEDTYENGKFIEGKTIKADGTIITYNDLEKLPEFKGGIEAFGKFLNKNLRYPPNARKNKIQGRVFINFVVESDGSLTGLKVLEGVEDELDKEALRVISLLTQWIPGLQRGIPVRVSYIVPIFFQLAY